MHSDHKHLLHPQLPYLLSRPLPPFPPPSLFPSLSFPSLTLSLLSIFPALPFLSLSFPSLYPFPFPPLSLPSAPRVQLAHGASGAGGGEGLLPGNGRQRHQGAQDRAAQDPGLVRTGFYGSHSFIHPKVTGTIRFKALYECLKAFRRDR